jgi:hypothetical protein
MPQKHHCQVGGLAHVVEWFTWWSACPASSIPSTTKKRKIIMDIHTHVLILIATGRKVMRYFRYRTAEGTSFKILALK